MVLVPGTPEMFWDFLENTWVHGRGILVFSASLYIYCSERSTKIFPVAVDDQKWLLLSFAAFKEIEKSLVLSRGDAIDIFMGEAKSSTPLSNDLPDDPMLNLDQSPSEPLQQQISLSSIQEIKEKVKNEKEEPKFEVLFLFYCPSW